MGAQTYHFQKLTPKDDVKLGIYEEALEYAFANKDICNIAISGAYGAGKSSVIESYKKKHPERRFLHISLAHFTDEASVATPQKITESDLEGKIINQLVHQIPPDKIPQTNFVMKKKVEENSTEKGTVAIVLFILLGCFLGFHEEWCRIVEGLSWSLLRGLLAFTTTKEMVLLCGAACIVMLVFVCYELVKRQVNRSILRRLNIKGDHFGIELFDGEAESYFDKYLNEVLYLFESVGADAIVFEDMDRYDINLIFEKLREINILLNRRSAILSKGDSAAIRFVYQLRDDMFVTKDRTKFFDLIIPVVPVVDGSNSLDLFLDYFEESGIKGLFDGDFLYGLSLYVDDMRMLKNICNEFLIYHAKLQESPVGQNDNKLLAMIVYKNIFPRDFAELQISQGYVYHLFQEKERFIKKETDSIQTTIWMLEEEEKSAAAEFSKSLDELDAIYYVNYRPMKVDNKTVEQFTDRAEFIAAIKANNYVVSIGTPSYYSSEYSWSDANVKDKFDALLSNPEYATRKKAIESRTASNKSKRRIKLFQHRNRLDAIQTAYLKDIITKENADAIFEAPLQRKVSGEEHFDYMKRSPYFSLIKYLIRNGYIDETYHDYMTFFYENSIGRRDKVFLRSVTDMDAKEYDYALQNAQVVVDRMRVKDFEAEESWNYDLLDALLVYSEKYREKLERFVHGLWNREPSDFVNGYIERGKNIREFAGEFNEAWHRACVWVVEDEEISETAKKRYLLETLCESDEALLAECNKDGELTDYIRTREDFLDVSSHDMDEERLDAMLGSLAKLDVKFVAIDMENANKALLQTVYSSDMYELSEKMIASILEYLYQIPRSEEYRTKNLSLILSQDQPLADYVKGNLENYIRMRIETANSEEHGKWCEKVDSVLLVLNEETLEQQHKLAFIKQLSTKLPRLADVRDKELWRELLPSHVSDSPENICDYFYLSGNEMDEALVEYLNGYEGELALANEWLEEKYEEGSADKLFWAIVKENGLDNDRYCSLLNSIQLQINIISLPEIDQEKVECLIQEKILAMTDSNLQFVRENYPDLIYLFIDSDILTYIEIAEPDELHSEEVAHVLEANIDDSSKLMLLNKEKEPISVMGKNYSDAVVTHILQHNLDEEEKALLYRWYPEELPRAREEIRGIAQENIEEVISSSMNVHRNLLDELLRDERISVDNRKHLLANGIYDLNADEIREYLRVSGWSNFEALFEGKRPTFAKTRANEALLVAFRNRGWLTRFGQDKEDAGRYRAIGRRHKEVKIS